MAESVDGLVVTISGDVGPLRASLSDASRLSDDFARDLTRAFDDAAVKGRTLEETMKRLVASLSSHALESALSVAMKIVQQRREMRQWLRKYGQ
ncbi:hypothetical protein A7A08_02130 [Methyloligella halotolerans]|uniref:Uncharacterized protein n=1 Tax=Methyloligella halotolerans TaxID=1177755 RepID=A0A1E2RX92_9HYPH|nr:hypothetical protein [Methyloligella halotolerans]ODA66833.1 hypothetical protein A7A08_02130 [Methyloligella halotolerans]